MQKRSIRCDHYNNDAKRTKKSKHISERFPWETELVDIIDEVISVDSISVYPLIESKFGIPRIQEIIKKYSDKLTDTDIVEKFSSSEINILSYQRTIEGISAESLLNFVASNLNVKYESATGIGRAGKVYATCKNIKYNLKKYKYGETATIKIQALYRGHIIRWKYPCWTSWKTHT